MKPNGTGVNNFIFEMYVVLISENVCSSLCYDESLGSYGSLWLLVL